MAIKSGFFNSVNGDRRYDADFFAEFFGTLIGNGVFANPSIGLQVVAGEAMSVSVKIGKGWVGGHYITVYGADYNLQLDVADGVLKRIDRIVLRLTYSDREIIPVVKKGVFASTPVAPTLQRDADAYELALADVLINNGVTEITQANITDNRFNTALCGIVKGTVDDIDTTDLFAQYTDAFTRWFENLQAQLDDNVASNLQNQIDKHNSAELPHKMTDAVTGVSYQYGIGIENGEFCILREVIK